MRAANVREVEAAGTGAQTKKRPWHVHLQPSRLQPATTTSRVLVGAAVLLGEILGTGERRDARLLHGLEHGRVTLVLILPSPAIAPALPTLKPSRQPVIE